MMNGEACPSCGRIGGAGLLTDAVKCDHCYAATRRRLKVIAEFDGVQRIVLTQGSRGFQLFINGNLQFSSSDEFVYHEALVHPLICWCERESIRRVGILGGGDGLAAREVLRYPSVESLTLVDYDLAITRLASKESSFRELNADALNDPRVTVINDDAVRWIRSEKQLFDVIIVDFPDPQMPQYAELYTRLVFEAIASRLAPRGQFVVQATSPGHCPRTFGCIAATIEATGLATVKYGVPMRSFGDWGFVIGRETPLGSRAFRDLPSGLRFLTKPILAELRVAHFNEIEETTVINEDNSGVLFRCFDEEWRQWVSELQQTPIED